MLISLDYLVKKYNIIFKNILHIENNNIEEYTYYEKYIDKNKFFKELIFSKEGLINFIYLDLNINNIELEELNNKFNYDNIDYFYIKSNKNFSLIDEYLKEFNFCRVEISSDNAFYIKKYIIFKESESGSQPEKIGDSIIRYFATILLSIKYNYQYILEEECSQINEYLFYEGVDYNNDDIYRDNNLDINNLKNSCNKIDNALSFNTLGFIKKNFNIDNLTSNMYINKENNHGIYLKNIINITYDNFFKYYDNNISINNLFISGKFYFNKIYLENKNEIMNFIEKNKDKHKIIINKNIIFIKDLINNIDLDSSKIYDIVIHLELENICYKTIISLIKKMEIDINKRCAIIYDKSYDKLYNEKNYKYINKILIWFKENNIDVNCESNDLIMDFNIMKQSKILICSNNNLSLCAAYLSKNIELCYIPSISSFNSNPNSTIVNKPINNTIFYENVKTNCYICGCVLNCEKYLVNIFNNIIKIGSLFEKFKIIISYDESTDNTLELLNIFKSKINNANNKYEIEILINKNKMSKYKTENISNARNLILDYIRTEDNDDYNYFIMMDFDDVCEKEVNIDILNKYLKNNNWDSLSFNRKEYYDIWALSIKPYVTSCWHWNKNQMESEFVVNIMKNYIKNKLDNLDKNNLLECYSAFNGFSIYKKDKFINCNYSNNIFKSHALINNELILENINKLNEETNKNNLLYMNLLEDCEHRYFHLSAIEKNNSKIMISSEYLFNENLKNKEENDCIYVSSRGFLESCDVKSITPISSINKILNYDYSKLYDGCTIYMCNYAIPYFSTFIHRINNKFILVSGDSNCTVPDELFKNNIDFENFINNEKIIHWYSQNCILNHPKISRIPIGLNYHTINEKKLLEILKFIKKNSEIFWKREIKCYANFNFSLDKKYGNDRSDAINSINKELVYYETEKNDKKIIFENQSKYSFVICPHGNGLDTYRTWEALCLGCIPIIKKSNIIDLFQELPVLIIDDWKDITIDLLNITINKFKNNNFNYEKLTLKYWLYKIKE